MNSTARSGRAGSRSFSGIWPQGRRSGSWTSHGTGFFACLFAAEGHEATGIDLTPDMIKHAEHMAAVLGLDATFRIMDAENPDFEPESFDVLVTRNLTWTLPHVEKAYREWYRILKPGGVLINFDADYSATLEDEQQGGEKHELPKTTRTSWCRTI